MIRFWVGFCWGRLRIAEMCKFSGPCAPLVRALGVDCEKETRRQWLLFFSFFPFLFFFFTFLHDIRGGEEPQSQNGDGPFFFSTIPMFMNCEHLGAFFVSYALFVMFNYYPLRFFPPSSFCSTTFLNRVSCEERIKPATMWGLDRWRCVLFSILFTIKEGLRLWVFRGVFFFYMSTFFPYDFLFSSRSFPYYLRCTRFIITM